MACHISVRFDTVLAPALSYKSAPIQTFEKLEATTTRKSPTPPHKSQNLQL